MNQPVIKWTGSKRYLSNEIISYFKKDIDTYYEPFIGGGSVLFNLLKQDDIKCKRYITSDINNDLITLWNDIKSNPKYIKENYKLYWKELNDEKDILLKKEVFYKIRREFNETRDTAKFMFLGRTSINGLIRYNSKNEFNSSLHFTRPGINPDKLNDIIDYWSNLLNKNNVEFLNRSYEKIITDSKDVLYLDPPYANTKAIYYGTIDYELFFKWVSEQKSQTLLSFDGKTDKKDYTFAVPEHIFDKHIYNEGKNSSFNNLNNNEVKVKESLYIKNS